MRWRRTGLAARITLLGIVVALVTGVLAGALAVGLIRNAGIAPARQALARLADAVAQAPPAAQEQMRLRRTLQAVDVRIGRIAPDGSIQTAAPLVHSALDAAQVASVLAGEAVSTTRTIEGTTVLVEARAMPSGGGVVLVQRHGDATAADRRAITRTVLAILVGVVIAALVGAVVARRMARSLRRTAEAARALASGRRDVAVVAEGPAEVAGVAEAVNTLAAGLAHSEARQREFLLSVSHDLRTPLTAITGYAESLARGVIPPDQAPSAGEVIQAEAARLDRLVSDLLDLARLDARDFRIDLVDIDIVSVVTAAAEVWRARCERAGVPFSVDTGAAAATGATGGTVLRVHTDPGRVRQLLDGLLENALRVTPAGAPIVLATRAEGAYAVLEVRDGGPGLRDEDLAVAFDRGELYRRYRGVRQVGTGLGLAVVAGLAARLGGSVAAGHAPEGGARFTVRLPLG